MEERNTRKWGFVNNAGKIAIEPIYDTVNPFSQNYAVVILMGKSGIIDRRGKSVIPPIYDNLHLYDNTVTEKLIPFSKDKRGGFLDFYGNVILNGFNIVNNFYKGIAPVCDRSGRWIFINNNGEPLVEPAFQPEIVYRFF